MARRAVSLKEFSMILNSQNPCPNSVLELALIKVNQKPEFYA
jgi:hypothetical protein